MGITVGLQTSKINMKSFTIAAFLCLASSTYGAPQGRTYSNNLQTSLNIQNVPAKPLTAVKSSTSTNKIPFLPAKGPLITNIPNQGPSFDTAFGAIPLGTKHFMTRAERNQYLPVMRALEKVMATSTPAPEDVNTLLVLTRDLTSQIPEGTSIPIIKLRFPGQIQEGLQLLELLHVPVQAGLGGGGGVQPAVQNVRHLSEIHPFVVTAGNLLLRSLYILPLD